MSWIWAAMMPHPPIIVPEIGRGREREAKTTIDGVEALTGRIGRLPPPERLLLLSPHQPYSLGALAVNTAPIIKGSFAPFGAGQLTFELRTPQNGAEELTRHLEAGGLHTAARQTPDLTPDQGTMVPLYFLERVYAALPPTILANPIGLGLEGAEQLGRALASFDDGRSWALLASGDLSHRLTPTAPAGFSPAGQKLDSAVVESLRRVTTDSIQELSARAIEDAGECGLRSAIALIGLAAELGGAVEVLSYEGPFGVGYCNALWQNKE